MNNHVSGKAFNLILVAAIVALYFGSAAGAGDEPLEEYEPPPEGFEERHYSIKTLIECRNNFHHNEAERFHAEIQPLTPEQIVEILKYSVQPDSWTRRGPARIQLIGSDLVILHRNEAHVEIAKVLKWISEAVSPAARTTVVITNLKPETLKAFAETGVATAAELFKAIDEAGDAAATEIVELSGSEGQQSIASGTNRQSFIRDFDASGATYDPVVRSAMTGLLVRSISNRAPDGKTIQVELKLSKYFTLEMGKAQIALNGPVKAVESAPEKPEKKDEKKDEKTSATQRMPELIAGSINANLEIALPGQIMGSLATTLTVPNATFVLAGTLDLTATGNGRQAVFVRAAIGSNDVSILQGVSGLKEGESFRLYPINASTRTLRDFPGPSFWIQPGIVDYIASGTSNAEPGAVNPFTAAPSAPALQTTVLKSKQMFAEKVRKNKIVEAMGSFVFARLNNEDHARLMKTLSDDLKRRSIPVRVRAIAIAVPAAVHRKLAIEGIVPMEAAAVDAIAKANGAQVLADSYLDLPHGTRAYAVAGNVRSVLSDCEISGDSYDPLVTQMLDRGYSLDLKATVAVDQGTAEVELRFHCIPGAASVERMPVQAYSVSSGATVSLAMATRAELDRLRSGIIEIKGNMNVPAGKYMLAGSARMPSDQNGNPSNQQVLLFLRTDLSK